MQSITFTITCSSSVRVALSDRRDEGAAQLEIQLPLRQGCGNKKPISGWDVKSVATPQHLVASLILHAACCPLSLTHTLFVQQSLVQYDAVFRVYPVYLAHRCSFILSLWVWHPFAWCHPSHNCLCVSACVCVLALLIQIQSSLCPVRCMAFYSYLTVLMVHIGMEAMQCAGNTVHWTMELLTLHTHTETHTYTHKGKCMLIGVN